jgi:transposase
VIHLTAGTKIWLALGEGRFILPQATEGTVHLAPTRLSMLLEGIDWRRPQRTWTPEIAV